MVRQKKTGIFAGLLLVSVIVAFVGLWCQRSDTAQHGERNAMTREHKSIREATLAGGCFWCTEADFEKLSGVVKVVSGYAGGHKDNPSYEEVSAGTTGHVEVVQVSYDPSQITYEE